MQCFHGSASHGRFGGQSDQLDLQLGPRMSSGAISQEALLVQPCACGERLQASLVLSTEAPTM